jgi:hypothetical protein
MKLSQLLASRSALLRQASLANAAFAYSTLAHWARRVDRARLHGPVLLSGVDPSAGRFAPELVALRGNQSVLDEHFDEGDRIRLADALAYVAAPEQGTAEFEFRLEELFSRHAPALRDTLLAAGVQLDDAPVSLPEPP